MIERFFFVLGIGKCLIVKWLDIHQESFDKLKGEICKDSVLKNPDFNRKFILQTDASQIGMGAVLQQEFEDGRHPVPEMIERFSLS
jgi:hypothetical protein